MAGLAPLIGEFLGTERADITLESGGDGWTLRVGDDASLGRQRRARARDRRRRDADVDLGASRRPDADGHAVTAGPTPRCSVSTSSGSHGAVSPHRSTGPPEPMTTTVGAEKRRAPPSSALVLLALAGVAWIATIVWILALDMSLEAGTMGLSIGEFVVMWTLMMAAMMLPAISPLVSMYARSVQGSASALDRVRCRIPRRVGRRPASSPTC